MDDIHNLKTRYRNTRDSGNIRNNFLRPCLKHFKSWKRCTFNFNSSALKSWAGSFVHIINDDVKIEILCDIGTVKDDRDLMLSLEHCQNQKEKEETIRRHKEKILLAAFGADSSLDNQDGFRNKYGWSLLHYMLATEKLVVKFAVNTISNDYTNIYHEKCGYFTFEDGTVIAHYGTFNESVSAHIGNNDSVMVFSSKRPIDDSRREEVINDVDDDFRGTDSVTVLELSKETLEKIKENAPSRPPKREDFPIDDEPDGDIEPEDEGDKLWEHQSRAIDQWFGNNGRGIIAHATGTGKTFTSIKLIEKLIDDKSCSIIIGVPYVFLADQWSTNLNENFKNIETHEFNGVIECYDNLKQWRTKASDEIFQFKNSQNNSKKHLSIYLTVNKTLISNEFQSLFSSGKLDLDKTLFIGDECHHYTSKINFSALLQTKYRLGLSATPFIRKNEKSESEEKMNQYFDGIIDEYEIVKALKDGRLSEFEYLPQLCNLNNEEFQQWGSVIRHYKIDEKINSEGFLDEDSKEFKEISKVISACEEKFKKFHSLLEEIGDLEKAIIFCGERKLKNGEREIDSVSEILTDKDIVHSNITHEVNRRDREDAIHLFKRGDIKNLNAIRVLDEGIDIPSIEIAILLASSANRRQFVQRRGRVLRKIKGEKKVAKLYDFIILPPPYNGESGRNLVEKELERMQEMSSGALNEEEVFSLIKNIRKGFEIG